MKQICMLLLVVMSMNTLMAQQRDERNRNRDQQDQRNQRDQRDHRDVPQPVQRSFQRDNPNYNNVQWSRSGNQWHATYPDRRYNNRNAEVYYDRNGRMRDRHVEWNQNEVPQPVRQNITTRYHVTNGYNVSRIERPNSQPLFQIRLNTGGQSRQVYMDENGREVRYRDRH